MTIKLFNRNKKTDNTANFKEKYSNVQLSEKELQRLLKIKDVLDEYALVAITDKNGTITYVNKEFCKLSKYSEDELIGQNHRILKSGYHPPQFYQGMWKTISSGKAWRGEVKNKAKDGTLYWVKTIIIPFLDKNGKPEEYVSIRTDVTAQKTLQDQLLKAEKLSIIGELSARLAHDLRNPLSVIKNTIELIKIKNPDLPEKVLEDLYKLNRAISRMTYQLDDVLDFVTSKPLLLERCSVFKILYGSLERITKPPGIKINMPLNDVNIMADSEKLETVFVNLITNAIQAMSNGGEINMRIMDQKDHVVIEVEDTGPGITSDVLPYIFEPLFTTKQTGTGLGLIICKSIIEKHSGKIDARTIVGKGTTFVITLPTHI